MLLSLFMLNCSDAATKWLGADYPAGQIICFRAIFSDPHPVDGHAQGRNAEPPHQRPTRPSLARVLFCCRVVIDRCFHDRAPHRGRRRQFYMPDR